MAIVFGVFFLFCCLLHIDRRVMLSAAGVVLLASHGRVAASGGLDLIVLGVEPVLTTVNEPVTVTATLANISGRTLEEVVLAVAMGSSSGDAAKFRSSSRPTTIYYNVPDDGRIQFQDVVRPSTAGMFSVSVVGYVEGAPVLPMEAVQVRVVAAQHVVIWDVVIAFVFYAAAIGLMYAVGRWMLGGGMGTARFSPSRLIVALGAALMLVAPLTSRVLAMLPGLKAPGEAVFNQMVLFLVLFALGVLIVGAGVRPRGSMARGVALASMVYVVVGYFWLMLLNALLLGEPLADVLPGLARPSSVIIALQWPVQVAQYLEIAGLSFQ